MAFGRFLAVVVAIAATAQAPGSAFAQERSRGAVLFEFCSTCHGDMGQGNQMYSAPAIAGLSQWYVEAQLRKFRTGMRGAHPDDTEGLRMRPMSRTLASDEDVVAVAAHIASLPPTQPEPTLSGGDAARGQVLFATCAACHGMNGEGNQQLSGPSLTRTNDWYLLVQLEKFVAGIRGGDTRDMNGIMMRPMAMALGGEQGMRDVVAHIATLSK